MSRHNATVLKNVKAILQWLLIQKHFTESADVKQLISPHFLPCPLGGAMSLLSTYLSPYDAMESLFGL